MARLGAGLSDEEFVGYTFRGPPERRPRLWFLDRHIERLLNVEGWTVGEPPDVGTWMSELTHWRPGATRNPLVMPGDLLRYQHHSEPPWVAVWELTDVMIPHVETFGQDDTWRLGLWPD